MRNDASGKSPASGLAAMRELAKEPVKGPEVEPASAPSHGPAPRVRPRLAIAISHLFENDTDEARELLASGDGLELKNLPIPDWIPAHGAKVFHCGLGLAEDDFERGFREIGRLLGSSRVELFSCDLGPAAGRRLGLIPLSPILSPEEIIERSKRSVELVRRSYSGEMAAENYNYYPTGLYENICRPDFIARFLEELDLSLTLDLAHAAISAFHLGLSLEGYISDLPLLRVVEIHVSQPYLPSQPKAMAADAHFSPTPRELGWLKSLMELLEKVHEEKAHQDGPSMPEPSMPEPSSPGPSLPDSRRASRERPWIVVEHYSSLKSVRANNMMVADLLAKRGAPI